MPSTKEMALSSLKMSLKRLRFWYNNHRLTPYGCREFILFTFVSRDGPGVQTITLAKVVASVGATIHPAVGGVVTGQSFCCRLRQHTAG